MPYKSPEAKYLANQRRNLIRKAQRREAKAEKIKENTSLAESYRKEAEELRLQASRYYTTFTSAQGKRTRKTKSQIEQLIAETEAIKVDVVPSDRQLRQNEITKNALNNPKPAKERIEKMMAKGKIEEAMELENANPNAKYTQEQVQTFYKATQQLWQGKSGDRNYLIMKGLRDRGLMTGWSLKKAVEIVLNMVEESQMNPSSSGGYEIVSETSKELAGPDTKDPSPRHLQTVQFIDEMMQAIATYAPTETEE